MTTADWLAELTSAEAASGREGAVQDLLRARLSGLVDRFVEDAAGNLLAFRDGPPGAPLLLLAAHCDQVALFVDRALPGGFLRVRAPGIDAACLPGMPVQVLGRPGVIGMLPPHLRQGSQGEAPTEQDLYLDLGIGEGAELPAVGTPVYFRASPRALGRYRFSAPALDNRASVAALCLLLEGLRGEGLVLGLCAAFTAGEETGRGGAAYLGASQTADLAVVLDVTFASQPELDDEVPVRLGGGPAIGVGPNATQSVVRLLEAVAREEGIPVQREPLPGDSGTDAWLLQVGATGIACGLLSIPLTSMHSPAEVVALDDVTRTADLLAALARRGLREGDLSWD